SARGRVMIRKLAYLLIVASVIAFGVGFIAVFSGETGFLPALLMIGVFGFFAGFIVLQFSGQGMTRAEGPHSFTEVDAEAASTKNQRATREARPQRTWTRTWMGVYFWVALGEFYLGLLFVVGWYASGQGGVDGAAFGGVMWLIAAVFAYLAFRTAAKDR